MAKLDYALLAEYARVDAAGLLTVVGGSFDRVRSPGPGTAQQVYVAMRVLLDEEEEDVPIEVRAVAPDDQYELGISTMARRSPAAQPADTRAAATLAVGLLAPLPTAGRYVVRILIDGEPVRELPFVVELGGPAQ